MELEQLNSKMSLFSQIVKLEGSYLERPKKPRKCGFFGAFKDVGHNCSLYDVMWLNDAFWNHFQADGKSVRPVKGAQKSPEKVREVSILESLQERMLFASQFYASTFKIFDSGTL